MGTRVDNLEERIYELEEKNKKLVKVLKVYANTEPYVLKEYDWGKQCLNIGKIAQDVLKEVGEEE